MVRVKVDGAVFSNSKCSACGESALIALLMVLKPVFSIAMGADPRRLNVAGVVPTIAPSSFTVAPEGVDVML
jgi:hypothetical protein